MSDFLLLSDGISFEKIDAELKQLGDLNEYNLEIFVDEFLNHTVLEILSHPSVKRLLFCSPDVIELEKSHLKDRIVQMGFDPEMSVALSNSIFALVLNKLNYEP